MDTNIQMDRIKEEVLKLVILFKQQLIEKIVKLFGKFIKKIKNFKHFILIIN